MQVIMQAIETTYLTPTNTRGSRIKARCERGSLTVCAPDAMNSEERHVYAADLLCKKFAEEDTKYYGTPSAGNHWLATRVCGVTKGGYAHVFTS